MALDHEAIYKAYPNCGWICDDARDHDGNKIDLDQSLIDAARV